MLPPRTSRGRRMRIAMKATVKPEAEHDPPWWAVRSFMARLETLGHQEQVRQVKHLTEARMAEERGRWEAREAAREVDFEKESRLRALEALERELGVEIAAWASKLDEGKVSAAAVARGVRIAAMLEKDAQALDRLDSVVEEMGRAVSGLRRALPEVKELSGGE